MRICQVSSYFPPFYGGSERYCYNLSKRLAEKHEVHVFTSRLTNDPKYELLDGIHVHRAFTPGKLLNINPISLVFPHIMREDFDIVHAHSYIFLTSLQTAFARKFKRFPYVLHLHGGLGEVPPQFSVLKSALKKAYDKSFAIPTVRFADALFSVSSTDIPIASRMFGVDEKKIKYMPNAVDASSFVKSDYSGSVLFVGRLESWKGANDLPRIIDAIDEKVSVIGGGTYYDMLRRKYAKSSRVKIMGSLPHSQVIGELSKAKALILPSYMEGLPTVILEAMASGVPSIAYSSGGAKELLCNSKAGALCEAGDTRLFSDKVNGIISDSSLMRRMGANGLSLVKEKYLYGTLVKSISKEYEGIVDAF